jgi:hypothetical protein
MPSAQSLISTDLLYKSEVAPVSVTNALDDFQKAEIFWDFAPEERYRDARPSSMHFPLSPFLPSSLVVPLFGIR